MKRTIVVIRTDDQDIKSMSIVKPDGKLLMKNTINLLPLEFNQFIVTSPLCAPSRASFLTGQYTHNHGVYSNNPPAGGWGALDESNLLPLWLSAAGYYNVHIGKYINGYTGTSIPPGWNEWYTFLNSHYFNYPVNENGTIVNYGSASSDYCTDVINNRAVDVLNRITDSLFLVVDHIAPHNNTPFQSPPGQFPIPAPRHLGLLSSWIPPHASSFNELDMSDKPSALQALPLLTSSDIAYVDDLYRRKCECLMSVDEGILSIIRACPSGAIVIFTSDNGFHYGEHRIQSGKDSPYEESIHLPLRVRGAGSGVVSSVVSNIDLASTICGIASASPGLNQDGVNLLQVSSSSRRLLIEAFGDNLPPQRSWSGIRYNQNCYIRQADTLEEEFYNLVTDPAEMQAQQGTQALNNELDALEVI